MPDNFESIHHNSEEEIIGYLRQGARCVSQAELPDELQLAAFKLAVTLAANKTLVPKQRLAVPQLGIRHDG